MTDMNATQPRLASLNQAGALGAQKTTPSKAGPAKADAASGDDKFSFWDLVDIINPLQHIPIVSSFYREITGDKINNFSRIAGGALFGGFIGAALEGVNAIAVNETGKDVGEIAMTKVGMMKDDKAAAPVKTAAVTPKSTENIPVIEVHPAPRIVMGTTKEKIIWDTESAAVKTAEATVPVKNPVADIQVASVAEAEKSPQVAAAMPTPQDLNQLEPGMPGPEQVAAASAPAAPVVPQQIAANEVPTSMMKALAKYQSMQRMGDTADPKTTGQIVQTPKFSGLDSKRVRRYGN